MNRLIAAAVLALATTLAQAATCVCTGTACTLTAASYPPGPGQPTSCSAYDSGGALIRISPVVDAGTIPASNAARCMPADAPYVPGPAGSVACNVSIGPFPAGNVTVSLTATNAAGETPKSAPFTFVSASALPALPSTPLQLRLSLSIGVFDMADDEYERVYLAQAD